MDPIVLIRFFATLLITNSHFDPLYPANLSFLATGGAIGNSFFFFVSGYGLYFSNKNSFGNWISKRLFRLYPAVWLWSIFLWLINFRDLSFSSFIIPPYWFLCAIVVFYFLFFLVFKYIGLDKLKSVVVLTISILIPYLSVYFFTLVDNSNFFIETSSHPNKTHWFYYFGIMLFGAYIAQRKSSLSPKRKHFFLLLCSIVLYYAFKYVLIKTGYLSLQFLLPLFLFLIVYYMYLSFTWFTSVCQFSYALLSRAIVYISSITLEIYIVQGVIIQFFSAYEFPIGFFITTLLIFVAASILNYLSKPLIDALNNRMLFFTNK